MLTTLNSLLAKAERGAYAIPAFNVTNLETVRAVISAAVALRSPVILQTSEAAIRYAGHRTLYALMRTAIEEHAASIPVVIHLDHGKQYRIVRDSVKLGYTSVHMDASELPWRENVVLTRRAAALGHAHDVTVQGELGYLLGYEGMTKALYSRKAIEKLMTDPDQAKEFVEKTHIDTLACALGTAHGCFKGKEFIDFKRLSAIRKRIKIPLVLHGGSGVSDAELRCAIALGIRIVNIDTTLRLRFMSGLSRAVSGYDPKKKVDIRQYLSQASLTMEKEAGRLITLLGSARKA